LTDGKQNPKGDISLKHAAGKLINDGIKTISIGIGSEVSQKYPVLVENRHAGFSKHNSNVCRLMNVN
jgi:hypothetical protein